ncbi:hypothetical protein EXIGLDRAFT_699914 [Exidia glandulosa HHB12029]|uniref:Uncharacterized protein n=1 Tax=Exidia glandulosa HHB12029 TaxID=1314781 RepID=A0A165DNJ6_EXIGL|nr:hypothetical protein EXIGLDRAFT_699914 [Exidia glandulosa HHB12029]
MYTTPRRHRKERRAAFTAVGWAVFAYSAYKVATTKTETTMYDPYDILGIKRDPSRHRLARLQRQLITPSASSAAPAPAQPPVSASITAGGFALLEFLVELLAFTRGVGFRDIHLLSGQYAYPCTRPVRRSRMPASCRASSKTRFAIDDVRMRHRGRTSRFARPAHAQLRSTMYNNADYISTFQLKKNAGIVSGDAADDQTEDVFAAVGHRPRPGSRSTTSERDGPTTGSQYSVAVSAATLDIGRTYLASPSSTMCNNTDYISMFQLKKRAGASCPATGPTIKFQLNNRPKDVFPACRDSKRTSSKIKFQANGAREQEQEPDRTRGDRLGDQVPLNGARDVRPAQNPAQQEQEPPRISHGNRTQVGSTVVTHRTQLNETADQYSSGTLAQQEQEPAYKRHQRVADVQTETDTVDSFVTKGYRKRRIDLELDTDRNRRINLELDTAWIRDDTRVVRGWALSSQALPLARSFPAATVYDPSIGARANSPPRVEAVTTRIRRAKLASAEDTSYAFMREAVGRIALTGRG